MSGSMLKPFRRVVGLRNVGNSCYINAVLQSLASCTSLRKYLAENVHSKQPLTDALRETIRELSMDSDKVIEPPISLLNVSRLSGMFGTRDQQDAHELMSLIMNILDDESTQTASGFRQALPPISYLKPGQSRGLGSIINRGPSTTTKLLNRTVAPHIPIGTYVTRASASATRDAPGLIDIQPIPKNPFLGLLASTFKCNECGRESNPQFQKFFGLSLCMPEKRTGFFSSLNEHTLYKCIDQFVNQPVEGVAWEHAPLHANQLVAGDANLENFHPPEPLRPPHLDDTKSPNIDTSSKSAQGKATSSFKRPTPPSPITLCCTSGKCNALLKWTIARPPKTLCLHVRRLVGTYSNGFYKLDDHVVFPIFLDLSQYCKNGASCLECSGITYSLVAVIEHTGNASGGHFTVYRKIEVGTPNDDAETYSDAVAEAVNAREPEDPPDYIWVNISDDRPTLVDESRVLGCQAYMLYYERSSELPRPAAELTQEVLETPSLTRMLLSKFMPAGA